MMMWIALLVLLPSVFGARRIQSLEEVAPVAPAVGEAANYVLSNLNLPVPFGLKEKEEIVSVQGNRKQKFKETYNGYEIYNTDIVVEVDSEGATKLVAVAAFDDLEPDLTGKFDCLDQLSHDEAEAITLSYFGQGPTTTVQRRKFTDLIYVDDNDVAHFTTSVDLSLLSTTDSSLRRLRSIVDKCDKTILNFYENHGFFNSNPRGNPTLVDKTVDHGTDDIGLYTSLVSGARSETADCDIVGKAGNPLQTLNFGPGSDRCLGPLKRQRILGIEICLLENDYTKGINNRYLPNNLLDIGAGFRCNQAYNDAANGGFSPMLDAFYVVTRTAQLLMERYNIQSIPVKDPIPRVITHYSVDYENAFWDGQSLYFGDGKDPNTYPFTTCDIAAHEYGHGFTEQRSNLAYTNQSGGMNEAFSDMVAQAVEEELFGQSDWLVGGKLFKEEGKYGRNMENPPEDGNSIKYVSDYVDGMDVHYSSGVYNYVFWRISQNLAGAGDGLWPFLIANQLYWSEDATFESGACGTMSGAYDAGIDLDVVADAFTEVGITFNECPDFSQFVTAELKARVQQEGMTVSSIRNPLFRVAVPTDANSITVTTSGEVRVAIRDSYKRSSVPLADDAGSATAIVTGGSEVFVQLYLAENNMEVKDVSATVTLG